jgi:hypothetical protein
LRPFRRELISPFIVGETTLDSMSTVGQIRQELEQPSDLHMVDWSLFGVFALLLISSLIVCLSLNAWCNDPASKYTQNTQTTFEPPQPEEDSKSK